MECASLGDRESAREKLGKYVISSRVRLARNIKGVPFVHRMSTHQAQQVIDQCKDVVFGSNSEFARNSRYIDMRCCSEIEKRTLVEEHWISPQMLDSSVPRGVILNRKRKVSIMLNEEDHLRIQSMSDGLMLGSCFDTADAIDNFFEKVLNFGFDERLGYLTCCPTNLGTAMRASAMIKLKRWSSTGMIDKLKGAVAERGMTIRGMYGEGSEAYNDVYQISNQVTLGVDEEETLEKLQFTLLNILTTEMTMN